jgi:DNA-binding NarL/FixJ family response regulator
VGLFFFVLIIIGSTRYIYLGIKIRIEPENFNDETEKAAETLALTQKQKQTLRFLIEGLTNSQIAKEECITIQSVKNEVSVILKKFGVKSRNDLIGRKDLLDK